MPSRRARPLLAAVAGVLAVAGVAGCGSSGAPNDGQRTSGPLLIAAAADLRPAFTELAERYERSTGVKVTLTFGASGQLAQQLEQGAPYALFASASADYVDQVLDAGRGDRATRTIYAYGRLAVWSPSRAYTFADLTDPAVKRIAVADPSHAPYGKAAIAALRAAGIFGAIETKLVYGDNVGATLQLAQSGNADVAVVARSLALSAGGRLTAVPGDLYSPLAQALVVTGRGADAEHAKSFVELLRSAEGQAVLREDGFLLPGSATPGTSAPAASPPS